MEKRAAVRYVESYIIRAWNMQALRLDQSQAIDILAEGVGFEPTVEFPPRRFSRPLP
jgi:hypothetical protein